MTRGETIRLAVALLLGMAIAFPVARLVRGDEPVPVQVTASDPGFRQVYSPRVLSDPHFLAQQRRNVEVLEQDCRARGEHCAAAKDARRWLEQHD
jgi:hypothetical protein